MANVSDVDSGAQTGIAVVKAEIANGAWFYTLDNGSNWLALGTVSDGSARLLAADPASTRLYFRPAADFNGSIGNAITFVAWDRSVGASGDLADTATRGGTSAFSLATDTASITVRAINDAPVIVASTTIVVDEDVATPITTVGFVDVDAGGLDVTASFVVGSGRLDAVSAGGVNVTGSGGLSLSLSGSIANINAFISDGRLTYTTQANATANVSLTVGIDDGGNTGLDPGLSGTMTSEADSRTLTIIVTAINDAPVLDASKSPVLAPVNEDAGMPVGATGTLVSALVDFGGPLANVTDVDSGAQTGIAVIAADIGNGAWFYSIDNGGNWLALGSVSESSARLLAADPASTRLYFQPVANFNGNIANAISFRAWDRSAGSNGGLADAFINGDSSPFSRASDSASLSVTAVNDAPVIATSSGTLATTENAAATAIDTGLNLSDADNTSLLGATISISANFASGQDTLVFANQNGISGSWNAGSGVLTLSGSATLAHYQTALRSVAYANTSDDPSSALRTVSFSVSDGLLTSNVAARSLSVASVNDAPTISAPVSFVVTEDVAAALTGIRFEDIDAGTGSTTASFTVTSGTLSAVSSADVTVVGSASGLTLSGSLVAINNFIDSGALRFVTAPDAVADVGLGIRFDDGGNNGSGGVQSVSANATISVVPVKDAPRLMAPPPDQAAESGTSVRFQIPATTFFDPDIGDSLRYDATRADGSALPPWLRFDPATRSFIATPGVNHVGVVQLRVVATDDAGTSAQTQFDLVVAVAQPVGTFDDSQTPQPVAQTTDDGSPKSTGKPATTSADDAIEAIEEPIAALIKLDIASGGASAAVAIANARDNTVIHIDIARPIAERPLFQFGDVVTAPGTDTQPVLAAALLTQLSDISLSGARQTFLQNSDVLRTLEELRRQMAQQGDPQQFQTLSAIALSSGLSIGYIVWLIRGGILVSSMLSALPAWQLIDPLPVVTSAGPAKGKRPETDTDDPQVERLFDKRSGSAATRPGAQPTQNDNAVMQKEKST